jgi:uncharacterized protein
MNVIFHIDDSTKWLTVLSNIKHMTEWYQSTHTQGIIELLINGEAVAQTVKSSNFDLNSIQSSILSIKVCYNSLQQRKISENDLQKNVAIVPSGVVELALKQNEGFSYIKP